MFFFFPLWFWSRNDKILAALHMTQLFLCWTPWSALNPFLFFIFLELNSYAFTTVSGSFPVHLLSHPQQISLSVSLFIYLRIYLFTYLLTFSLLQRRRWKTLTCLVSRKRLWETLRLTASGAWANCWTASRYARVFVYIMETVNEQLCKLVL